MLDESMSVWYDVDMAALKAGRDVEVAQLKLNRVIRAVNVWMKEHGLSPALNRNRFPLNEQVLSLLSDASGRSRLLST